MSKRNLKKKTKTKRNVYQVRAYSIKNDIEVKITFNDEKTAKQYLTTLFANESDGVYYSRGVIRTIDPYLKDWIVPCMFANPKALTLDPEGASIDKWFYFFYDKGDNLMSVNESDTYIPMELLNIRMATLNAFYSVIAGYPDNVMMVEKFVVNRAFNLRVDVKGFSSEKMRYITDADKDIGTVYADLIGKDRLETERIIARRKSIFED